MLRKAIRDKVVSRLRSEGASFIAVFGSWARNEASSTSDLDILVRFSRPVSLLDTIRIERELSEELGVKVDLVTQNSLSPHLRDRVTNEMEVLLD